MDEAQLSFADHLKRLINLCQTIESCRKTAKEAKAREFDGFNELKTVYMNQNKPVRLRLRRANERLFVQWNTSCWWRLVPSEHIDLNIEGTLIGFDSKAILGGIYSLLLQDSLKLLDKPVLYEAPIDDWEIVGVKIGYKEIFRRDTAQGPFDDSKVNTKVRQWLLDLLTIPKDQPASTKADT